MPQSDTNAYYGARAVQARELANSAGDEQIRVLHFRNAESYDALAAASGTTQVLNVGITEVFSDGFSASASGTACSGTAPSADSLALMLTDAMPLMVWSTLADGYHDYFNAQWYAFTGATEGSTDGAGWNEMFHPEDRERAWQTWRASLESGDLYEIEYRLRHHSGAYRWTLGRAQPVRDSDGAIIRWIGTCTDIDRLKKAEELSESLAIEMSHRISNLFAVVSGLIGMAARSETTVPGFVANMQGRIAALGAAHLLVTMPTERPDGSLVQSGLHAMISHMIAPFNEPAGRLSIEGDDIIVDDGAATATALIFHELSTNAAKYGALSVEGGSVTIHTTVYEDGLTIIWTESGGPIVASNRAASGFGTKLTDRTVTRQLGGKILRSWEPAGLVVRLDIDVSTLTRGGGRSL